MKLFWILSLAFSILSGRTNAAVVEYDFFDRDAATSDVNKSIVKDFGFLKDTHLIGRGGTFMFGAQNDEDLFEGKTRDYLNLTSPVNGKYEYDMPKGKWHISYRLNDYYDFEYLKITDSDQRKYGGDDLNIRGITLSDNGLWLTLAGSSVYLYGPNGLTRKLKLDRKIKDRGYLRAVRVSDNGVVILMFDKNKDASSVIIWPPVGDSVFRLRNVDYATVAGDRVQLYALDRHSMELVVGAFDLKTGEKPRRSRKLKLPSKIDANVQDSWLRIGGLLEESDATYLVLARTARSVDGKSFLNGIENRKIFDSGYKQIIKEAERLDANKKYAKENSKFDNNISYGYLLGMGKKDASDFLLRWPLVIKFSGELGWVYGEPLRRTRDGKQFIVNSDNGVSVGTAP